ncbi:TspO/MBR family protein [Novosphingobium sp.]|uniref:TspO/MBR family protein n=1 Tax=Novosphingobium sp. TaxID=1874826 RepID=UPI00286B3911|nr:TspO/MBR family protein [Novosphingobium sp.]
MSEIASPGQLRSAFLRWALFIVPGVLFLGFFSGQLGGSGAGNPWFMELNKPSLYPPPALFGIVWSVLYVMMGIALTLVVTARGAAARGAAIVSFAVQLALNLAWSPLFFGAHQITAALVLLVVLDAAITITIILFRKVRPLAAWLLLPYLAWALFATVLNWQFREANPDGAVGADIAAVLNPAAGKAI